MSDRIKTLLYYLIIFVIFLIAVYIRVLYFSYARPFWNDESALALNLVGRNFFELFLPLDFEQTAPPLFLCASKFFLYYIKEAELALRLVPLICSIISIPVFFLLCKQFCKSKISNIFALILFCFNYQIVYYAQEFKQYSSDILIFMLILLSYFYFDFKSAKKLKLIAFGTLLGLILWFSYTAVFAVLALAVVLIIKNFNNLQNIWENYVYCFFTFSIFLIIFFILKQNLNNSFYLHLFWNGGFLNWDLSNLYNIISDNLHFYFVNFTNKIVVYILVLIGCGVLIFNLKNTKYQLLMLCMAFAFLLSYMHVYPLYNRVSLYLSPLLFIVMSLPFEGYVAKKTNNKHLKKILTCIFVSLTVFVFLHFYINYINLLKLKILDKQYYVETTPYLLKVVEAKMQKGDYLYISALSSINYQYYKHLVNIHNVIIETFPVYDIEVYKRVFVKLSSGKTYYLIMTHSGDKILEFNNLVNFLQTQSDVEILADDNYNLLIKFTKK